MARLRLRDGRSLGFDVHGPSDGDDVGVVFHGTPGSRGFVPGPVEGVRLVVFDRPGFGESDPQPNRVVGDTAADVADLLDHVHVERARLLAWSGGCPFAAATACRLGPTRVRTLTLVSGPGPLDEVDGAWEALGDLRGPTARVARNDRAKAKRAIARNMVRIIEQPERFVGAGRGPDATVIAEPSVREGLVRQIEGAVAQGSAGVEDDLTAMWLPWGFALSEISVPTFVFQGALDPDNAADARTYAAKIPNARLTMWPDGGHLAIVANWSHVLAAGSLSEPPR